MIVNTERHVNRLNALLRKELGTSPHFAWQYTGSLFHPVIELTTDECAPGGLREVYETVCKCGEGVNVHSTDCTFSLRRKKAALIPIMQQFPDAWIVCQKVYPDESAWSRSFGTVATYPTEGYWFPFTVQVSPSLPAIYLKTERGKLPTDEQTSAAIWAIQEWRNTNPDVVKYEEQRAAERAKAEKHENLVSEIKEVSAGASLSLIPGKKANASYSDPVRLKPTIYNSEGVPV